MEQAFYARMERVRDWLPSFLRSRGIKKAGIGRITGAILLEYVATTLFVFYACGSVVSANVYQRETLGTVSQNLFAAIVQGFAIATLVYAISHTSGGHINPAVTLAMIISGNMGIVRGAFYIISQLLGGITGAALLKAFLTEGVEGQLGTTNLGAGLTPFQGYLFEFVITFGLLFTIFGTALHKEAAASGTSSLSPLPIGFSVTVGVGIAFSFTGGSMNPARTLGPALMSHTWSHHYVYWAGPFTASVVVGLLELFFSPFSQAQQTVYRAAIVRKEIKKQRAVNAVAVILEPGSEPVNMIPMNDPEHPGRNFMVPVANDEQLRHLTDELDEPQGSFLRGSSPASRRMTVLGAERSRIRALQGSFGESSRRSSWRRPSSFSGFKRKQPISPPIPLSDFSYLSDEGVEDLATSTSSLLRPSASDGNLLRREMLAASPDLLPKKPPIRPSSLRQGVTVPMPPESIPKIPPAPRSSRSGQGNSPGTRHRGLHQSASSPHLTLEFKDE